jgi:methylated-DNA-[protein]-cysteine S-methyltransferase
MSPDTDVHDDLEAALRRSSPDPGPAAADAVRRAVEQAARDGLVDVAWTLTDTPVGPVFLAATEAGLVRVHFGRDDAVLEELARQVSPRVVEHAGRLDPVRRELDEYFAGRRHEFDVPLDWRLSHGFRRTVLERLYAEVPFGATTSYLALAGLSGNAKASRAVGTAMATNPLAIIVPCHRVLRTGGGLGGYAGGLDAKRHLLALEGSTLL